MDIIDLQRIKSAQANISAFIRKTPLHQSLPVSNLFKRKILFKLENWQKTGSFKIRGALNRVLTLQPEVRDKGVITASAGNHGLGVALACKIVGAVGKVVVPMNVSDAKLTALQNYEIEIIQHGQDYDEAEALAVTLQEKENLTFVHAFDDPDVIAGQGTIGLEILEDLPEPTTLIVPIGGGGLISGVSAAIKLTNPECKIVGVQSEASPAMQNAIEHGKVIETPIRETLADGLAGRFVSYLSLSMTQAFVDDVILVSEEAIRASMQLMLEKEHMLVEGSAAVGIAALLEGKVLSCKRCVVLITGRNISMSLLKKIL